MRTRYARKSGDEIQTLGDVIYNTQGAKELIDQLRARVNQVENERDGAFESVTTLTARVAKLEREANESVVAEGELIHRAEAAEAEQQRLARVYDEFTNSVRNALHGDWGYGRTHEQYVKDIADTKRRAESAEAERDALRAALLTAKSWLGHDPECNSFGRSFFAGDEMPPCSCGYEQIRIKVNAALKGGEK